MSRLLLYTVAVAVVALDQATKCLVVRLVPADRSWPVLGPYLSMTIRHNTGAAFGLFASATTGLTIVAIVTIVLIAVYGIGMARANRVMAVGLALALGGAAGNLLDRLRLGHVIDFIDLHFWPVFNIADIAITCAAVLIVVALAREHWQAKLAESSPQ